ncbi:hypothetical protein JH06_3577 [Blastocystis sp. subtype 4]|uniref:hypothetical protein n=1 Tax=Blastocystis sp. subtype 4 TaxID=944170 RepID=UPI000711D5DB|nr:hypothetical protein JH06_3577 [Blastocystis sp. subtype 4]KNB45488.1 hypothetical protein JH06_3577 [Blastocystis sp. subtype 4]|eukprot:XP_014528937.1 hypothetical protein JH06_3577 [Blastocystis sp. subtype 4]
MCGWMYLWFLQYKYYTSPAMDFWKTIEMPLKYVQTMAILEIIHSMLRIVRSPVLTTTLQVFSRIMILWGYANISEAAQQSFGIKLMVLSWSLVEVPRYLFYIVKTLNIPMPTWLLFLRYNLFYILYPTGITGEILVILASLPFVKSSHIFSMSLPNPWNFAFNYYGVSLFWLFLYVPLGPYMIKNMMYQRKKYV